MNMNISDLSPVTKQILDNISSGKRVSGRLSNQIPKIDSDSLILEYNTESVLASLYCIAKDITPPKCYCGIQTKFNSISKGFKQFCSVSCALKQVNKINNSEKNKNKAIKFKDSIKDKLKLCAEEYTTKENIKSICELAKEYDIPFSQIRRHLKDSGLIVRGDIHKKRHTKKMIDKYPELFDPTFFNQEQSSTVLSKELGLSPNTLCVYARKSDNPLKNNLSVSSAEYELAEFLGDEIKTEKNSRKVITPYELDIFLPEYKVGIEYNGSYWHSEQQGKDKHYHITKQKISEEKGIKLIQIFDFEWINRNTQIKGYINSILNKNITTIYGRKTEVKVLDKIITANFLEENHIQGTVNSKYNFGLYHGTELVSVLTLGKSRFTKKYDYEVLRYCNKIGIRVIGGLSKLIKYIKLNLEFDKIVSYSHRRLFDGNSFLKAGFELSHKTDPGYFWANKYSTELLPRYKTQKHKLNTELTEYEYMTSLNYVKIWDCGQLVFVLDNINNKNII